MESVLLVEVGTEACGFGILWTDGLKSFFIGIHLEVSYSNLIMLSDQVNCIAFGPPGIKLFATGEISGRVCIWSYEERA